VVVVFDASADLAERWADALLASGALSVDAGDAGAGTADETPVYDDPATHAWPVVRLTALFGEATECESALAHASWLTGAPVPAYSVSRVPAEDWVRKTQEQFTPIRVAERLWVVPSWRAPPDPKAVIVTLDPGLAFGTGAHPSTLLCLRWLAGELEQGSSVLDYGCGSGILAIAAAKLGAGRVVGIDIDSQAIATSRTNAQANEVVAEFGSPDLLGAECFDVVLANILANPLELLAPLFAGRVREGGHIVLSGILNEQADAVLAAYARWFNIGLWGSTDGWVALAGVRSAR
jgi:ribosomal protein L11 methyltransferase